MKVQDKWLLVPQIIVYMDDATIDLTAQAAQATSCVGGINEAIC